MSSRTLAAALAAVFVLVGKPAPAPHCDGMDGPVVRAAQKALESRNANHALIWVQRRDEEAIRNVFEATLRVRMGGPEAKDLADRFFFETLVRVHRAGEGATFTGLKPAGRDLGPAIPAADLAIGERAVEPLVDFVRKTVEEGLRERFAAVIAKKDFAQDDVEAGREYVKRYVEFIHYVERLYDAAHLPAHGHGHVEPDLHD